MIENEYVKTPETNKNKPQKHPFKRKLSYLSALFFSPIGFIKRQTNSFGWIGGGIMALFGCYNKPAITEASVKRLNDTIDTVKVVQRPTLTASHQPDTLLADRTFFGHYYTMSGLYIGQAQSYNMRLDESVKVLDIPDGLARELFLKGKDAVQKSASLREFAKGHPNLFHQIQKLSNSQLVDRAHWVYGEGQGHFARYYAHTMQNAYENLKTEEKLYHTLMVGPSGKINRYAYFSGHNPGAREFSLTRFRPRSRSKQQQKAIAGVIESILFPEKDPTNGSDQWSGGSGRGEIQGKWNKYHFRFFKYGKDYASLAPYAEYE